MKMVVALIRPEQLPAVKRALFAAQLAEVQTRAATTISVIELYTAMGGGWVELADGLGSERRDAAAEAAETAGDEA